MKFLTALFGENSEVSCMRVMSFLSLLTGASVTFYSIYRGIDLASATPVIGVFVGGAFGGKVAQKFVEGNGKSVEVSSGGK